jgi:hypothetical protein
MEKKQTAVDYLVQELIKQGFFKRLPVIAIQQAAQMEREQHEETWASAWNESAKSGDFTDYYNETYGGTK